METNILGLTDEEATFIRYRYDRVDPDNLLSGAAGMRFLRCVDVLEMLVRNDTKK